MKTVNLYLVRHGQTEFNLCERMQGRCDSPLTEKGIKDAYDAKEKLKDIKFDRVFCSPLKRVKDTVSIILEGKDIEIREDERIIEMSFGDWEAMCHKDIWDDMMVAREKGDFKCVNGENKFELKARLRSFYDEVVENAKDGENILVAMHGVTSMYSVDELLDIELPVFRKYVMEECKKAELIPNGYVGHLVYKDGKWIIKELSSLSQNEIEGLLRLKRK